MTTGTEPAPRSGYAFVRNLKKRTRGEIAVMGGIGVRPPSLPARVLELTLIAHPVIAGEGRRHHLFQPGDPVRALQPPAKRRTPSLNMAMTIERVHREAGAETVTPIDRMGNKTSSASENGV